MSGVYTPRLLYDTPSGFGEQHVALKVRNIKGGGVNRRRNIFRTFYVLPDSPEYFSIGITHGNEHGVCYLLATPEKALCDMILYDNYLPDRSLTALETYLEEDLRFDTDALRDFDANMSSIILVFFSVNNKNPVGMI